MLFKFKAKSFITAGLLLAFIFLGCSKKADGGPMAPDFALEDLSGKAVSLNQFRDRIVLLDFWATWCPPCRQSIPELIDLQKKYDDQGLVILGVSMDDPQEVDNAEMLSFKKHFKMNYRILRVSREVVTAYFSDGRMAIPTMFVINREGRITDKHVGYAPGVVETSVKKIL
ncbi:peroxiredoxin family protein [Thermodesulfobacteriota bacterium]